MKEIKLEEIKEKREIVKVPDNPEIKISRRFYKVGETEFHVDRTLAGGAPGLYRFYRIIPADRISKPIFVDGQLDFGFGMGWKKVEELIKEVIKQIS